MDVSNNLNSEIFWNIDSQSNLREILRKGGQLSLQITSKTPIKYGDNGMEDVLKRNKYENVNGGVMVIPVYQTESGDFIKGNPINYDGSDIFDNSKYKINGFFREMIDRTAKNENTNKENIWNKMICNTSFPISGNGAERCYDEWQTKVASLQNRSEAEQDSLYILKYDKENQEIIFQEPFTHEMHSFKSQEHILSDEENNSDTKKVLEDFATQLTKDSPKEKSVTPKDLLERIKNGETILLPTLDKLTQ